MKRNKKQQKEKDTSSEENFSIEITKNLDDNLDNIKKMLDNPNDLVIRTFTVRSTKNECAIVNIDGLVNTEVVHNNIIKSVQVVDERKELPEETEKIFTEIKREIISVSSVETAKTLDEVTKGLLSGCTVFYLNGTDQVLIIDTRRWETRAIEEPSSETVIRGPRNGFVESIRTNTMQIRREIKDPNLRFKTHYVGRRSKKVLMLCYLDGVVNPEIVKEISRRLESIDMDNAPESGYIEQWIEDSFLSPFPQLINTERPDKACAAVVEGKVIILLDGTPFVLIAPSTLGNAFENPEDYYERWTIGTAVRLIRYMAAFIAMFVPALYIALLSYHQGMIPTKLAFSIAATRDGVPFPPFIEAMLMGVTMELLREAGARLPKNIGQTIGIVGGLVIGDAAVKAGIVSPVMVVVVGVTAIASFSIPAYSVAISFRLVRFFFMFAAAVLGLYGIILVYIMINIHIANLKSIGVPYSTPFAPFFPKDWKDLIFRAPIPTLTKRPGYLQTEDPKSANKGDNQ